MKKSFLQLFSVIGVVLGAVWAVLMFLVGMWAGTESKYNYISEKRDPYNTPDYTPENMWDK